MILAEVNRSYKDFNCNDCANDYHCTETAGDELWPQSRGAAPFTIIEIPNVIESKVCLKPMVTQESMFYFKLHKHYLKGNLWAAGGVSDQPAVYLQIMELFDSLLKE